MARFTLQDIPKYDAIERMVERYPDIDPSAVEAYLYMMRVSTDVMDAAAARLNGFGITPGRFSVLMLLNLNSDEEMNPSLIAAKAGVTRATMTGLIDGLVHDELVTRSVDETNRREVRIALTRKGKAFIDRVLPGHAQFISRMMANLSEEERIQLTFMMKKIHSQVLEERREEE